VNLADLLGLSREALAAHRLRYGLSALAVGVGVAAVVLLASIGEGTRRFIGSQMTQFGTTLVAVHPGKTETGGMPGTMGGSFQKLTLDDARAMARLPGVTGVLPNAYGTAIVTYGGRGRRVYVNGITHEMPRMYLMPVAAGQFIPRMDFERTSPVVVLGPRVKRELFGEDNALGAAVRIGQARYRVIGIMEGKGDFLGMDLDDMVYVTVADAMRLFNRPELDEVDLMAASNDEIEAVAARARELMIERHDGNDDVTIITQKDAQQMVNRVLGIVTAVVTAIAAISLLVGAIGILTIMWIVVQERVTEIGLVKALGARRSQIMTWYLFEAAATALAGGIGGLVVGLGGAWLISAAIPGLEVFVPVWVVAAALAMALVVGLASGVAPAVRASALDPVEALRGE
jgi:putative ABC transport system permease protein